MRSSSVSLAAFVCAMVAVLQHDVIAQEVYQGNDDDIPSLDGRGLSPLNEEHYGAVTAEKRSIGSYIVGKIVWRGVKKLFGRRRRSLDLFERDDIPQKDDLRSLAQTVKDAQDQVDIEKSIALATPTDLDRLSSERVVQAQRYELPLLGFNEWFKSKHDGVVVTLANGRRLLVIKGYEFFRSTPVAVLDARVMSAAWKLRGTKESVQTSTLGDYIKAAETSYNSLNAAVKMMSLE